MADRHAGGRERIVALTNETTTPSYQDLARMIDYAALASAFSEEQISHACDVAKQYEVARLTVRPSDLDMAAAWMKGSGVTLATTVGYPHGTETTAVKLYAVRDALGRGAKSIATALNLGKLFSRQFRYLESELTQMAQECRRADAELILDFDLGSLPEDLRVIACKIVRRADVHRVRVGSEEDLQYLAARLGQVEAAAIDTLPDALRARELGCSGFQTTDPRPILDAWKAELTAKSAKATENPPS